MYKILSIFLILGIVGCEQMSGENAPKPPFADIEDCIEYVNKLDAKKGYPKRKKESVIRECKNSNKLMASE